MIWYPIHERDNQKKLNSFATQSSAFLFAGMDMHGAQTDGNSTSENVMHAHAQCKSFIMGIATA